MPRANIGEMAPSALLLTIFVVATVTWLFWKGLFSMIGLIFG